jgi:hypothetical protein
MTDQIQDIPIDRIRPKFPRGSCNGAGEGIMTPIY